MKPRNVHEEFLADLMEHISEMIYQHEMQHNQAITLRSSMEMAFDRVLELNLYVEEEVIDE